MTKRLKPAARPVGIKKSTMAKATRDQKSAHCLKDPCFVYWLHDETCSVPENDGYVGVAKNVEKRAKVHCKAGKFKAGFLIEILLFGTREECLAKERGYRPNPGMGWNVYSGGSSGRIPLQPTLDRISRSLKDRVFSEEHKEKIGAFRRNGSRPDLSQEARASIRAKLTGLKASEETRAKQSAKRKGKKRDLSEETREGMRQRMIGNTFGADQVYSEERREKQRDRMIGNQLGLGRKRTAAERKKISIALKDKKKSAAHRASLSRSRKAHCASRDPVFHTEATKAKQSVARKLWWEKNKKWKHSEETKVKMRVSRQFYLEREAALCV